MNYYILYNGGKIYYTDAGEGETVVLLHGYLESSEIWRGFSKKLAENFRVISVDLPGHGNSAVYSDRHSMEFMARAVGGLFGSLNIKKAVIAGHSMGGYVTLAFAGLFPDLLKGYCLFHSHPFADSPETLMKREREILIVRSGKKYLIISENIPRMFAASNLSRFGEAVSRSNDIASGIMDEGIIAALKGMMSRPSRVGVMEEGKIPLLWILGKLDIHIPYDTIQSRVRLPSNARVVVLENSGHMGFIEEEDRSVQILSEFINEVA
ncbi:MAG: alpha/beta hydrolase [Bacteroidales bacterium]